MAKVIARASIITGRASYSDSLMVRDLLDAGERVVVLNNLSTGHECAVDRHVAVVRGDLADIPLIKAHGVEYGISDIIHFVGSIAVPQSAEGSLRYCANNTAASHNLIEAAVHAGVKYILSSTVPVYGVANLDPVREETQFSSISLHDRSRPLSGITLANVAATHRLKFGALRYFSVAGADPKGWNGTSTHNATHFINVACQAALGIRERVEVLGTGYPTPDGACQRCYTQRWLARSGFRADG